MSIQKALCKWNRKKLLKFIVCFNVFFSLAASVINISRGILLISDIIVFYCFFVHNRKITILVNKENKKINIYILIFFLFFVVTEMLNGGSILLFLWGCRNYLRFYLFVSCCINEFELDELDDFSFKLFVPLSVLNLVAILYQRYILGITNSDMVGGIFGTISGCNASLNIFTILAFTYIAVRRSYLRKKLSVWKYRGYMCIVTAMLISAAVFAEIKILFFELLIVIVGIILTSKGIQKKIQWLLSGVIIGAFLLIVMNSVFPTSMQFLLDAERLVWYNAEIGYGDEEALNRLSAIEKINTEVFQNDTLKKWVGVGVGNASKINFLNLESNVYRNFYRLRYDWFVHSMIYIEQGYLGLTIYILFILGVGIYSFHHLPKKGRYRECYSFGVIVAMIAGFNILYNNALIMESVGYLCYFCMAMPFVTSKTDRLEKRKSGEE